MPFSAVYGAYNVQGSFNQWLYTNLTANGVPSWMPSARVVYDWGVAKELISGYSGHAFSVNHISDAEVMEFQGHNTDNGTGGSIKEGQVEINCWVSKQNASGAHIQRLRHMRDMVGRLFQAETFPIVNLYAAVTTAPSTTARAVLGAVNFQNPQSDEANPDLYRIRGVGTYRWNERDG